MLGGGAGGTVGRVPIVMTATCDGCVNRYVRLAVHDRIQPQVGAAARLGVPRLLPCGWWRF